MEAGVMSAMVGAGRIGLLDMVAVVAGTGMTAVTHTEVLHTEEEDVIGGTTTAGVGMVATLMSEDRSIRHHVQGIEMTTEMMAMASESGLIAEKGGMIGNVKGEANPKRVITAGCGLEVCPTASKKGTFFASLKALAQLWLVSPARALHSWSMNTRKMLLTRSRPCMGMSRREAGCCWWSSGCVAIPKWSTESQRHTSGKGEEGLHSGLTGGCHEEAGMELEEEEDVQESGG
jgi:hypothetical protein